MDKTKLMHFLLAVVEHGSFSAAARQMATSPSTVSKAIVRLEKTIGIQLFHRSTRQLRLTNEGELYANQIRSLLEQLEHCELDIKKDVCLPSGKLKISVPMSYGRLYIQPLIKTFVNLYPEIRIEISYNDRYIDIIEEGFDLCIRSGTLADSQLVVRQLSPMDFFICGAPSYLEKNQTPKSALEFNLHSWIRFRFQQTGRILPIMMPHQPSYKEYNPNQHYVVDDGEVMAEMCADGLGLTQIPHFIAKHWVYNRKIIPLFPAFRSNDFGVFLVYPKRDYLPARVKVFIDFLCQQIESIGETPTRTWANEFPININNI